MSSPFPLLRLPRLVLFEVFKSLSIGEKIKLSLCSTKICTQINDAQVYSQKVIVDLDMYHQKIEVFSENNKDPFEIFICSDIKTSNNPHIQRCRIGGHIVPVMRSRTKLTAVCWDHQGGYPTVIRHLSKIFRCKISIANSCWEHYLFQPIVTELFNQQLKFETLTVGLLDTRDHDFVTQVFGNMGMVKQLEIKTMINFPPSTTSTWPQHVVINFSSCFTLEHLLACTCTSIILFNSLLEIKDLDEVLRKWKAGGLSNLEYLYVEAQNFEQNGMTNNGTMVTQTDDGSKKATIDIWYNIIKMYVTPVD